MAYGVLAIWLGCSTQVTTLAQEKPQSNWTSADEPCRRYDNLRNHVLGDIGVKIDSTEPWADGFRRALSFWNTVLVAKFHEETNLDACTIRIINGGHDILDKAIVARSQLTKWDKFCGKIAVNPEAAKALSGAELYGIAVHEFGHMLGLKHNTSSRSVMFYLNVNGTEVLDSKDTLDLSAHHKLRPAIFSTGFRSLKVIRPEAAPKPNDAARIGIEQLLRGGAMQ